MVNLKGRSLLEDRDLSAEELLGLVELARELRRQKRTRTEVPRLAGRHLALVFEKTSTRTRASFEVAAHDQGAHTTHISPLESQFGHKESVKDSARVMGRMFDGIEYRGASQETVEALAAWAGVPVWNGLTDRWHPTQVLADVMTIGDHSAKPLTEVALCFLGDAASNTANSLVVSACSLGMDIRVGAPSARWPSAEVLSLARRLAGASGARLTVTESVAEAVAGADFVYTDVWLSMGEPVEEWDERIDLLSPYRIDARLMASTGNPATKLLHCLPALHDTGTDVGRQIHARRGLRELEVTDEVFESPASVVFDQAENRLHTTKALLVATLTDGA